MSNSLMVQIYRPRGEVPVVLHSHADPVGTDEGRLSALGVGLHLVLEPAEAQVTGPVAVRIVDLHRAGVALIVPRDEDY